MGVLSPERAGSLRYSPLQLGHLRNERIVRPVVASRIRQVRERLSAPFRLQVRAKQREIDDVPLPSPVAFQLT